MRRMKVGHAPLCTPHTVLLPNGFLAPLGISRRNVASGEYAWRPKGVDFAWVAKGAADTVVAEGGVTLDRQRSRNSLLHSVAAAEARIDDCTALVSNRYDW